MNYLFLSVTLFTYYLPHLIAASQCPSCDSFSAALKTCQTTGLNITAIGSKIDTKAVHCMCVTSSNSTEMENCSYCDGSIDEVTVDGDALIAWFDTCSADDAMGDQQAIVCWEGLPDDNLPCVENTGGQGSAFTSGGPDIVASSVSSLLASIFSEPANPFATESPFGTTSSSVIASLSRTTTRPATTAASKTASSSGIPIQPATTAPSTTVTPSTETTPSPKANSEATMSFRAFGLFSTIFITLGVLLATQ